MTEKQMTKKEARAWLARARDDLTVAYAALKDGNGDDLYAFALDAQGALAELTQALEPDYYEDPPGIRGVTPAKS